MHWIKTEIQIKHTLIFILEFINYVSSDSTEQLNYSLKPKQHRKLR